MKKYYVLDTNILLQNPNAIFGFEDNVVVITGTTLQELDSKKNMEGELGFNARLAARLLENIRSRGDILKGVKLKETGGKLMIEPDEVSQDNLPEGFDIKKPDNRIISSCVGISKKTKRAVILVTNDIMMRITAAACKVEVQEYKNDQIKETDYMGYREINTTKDIIDEVYRNQSVSSEVLEIDENNPLIPNEYITLTDGITSALCVYRNNQINVLKDITAFGIRPQNRLQRFALDALLAPAEEIPLVILRGPAGTAKTFLSVAAALDKTYREDYEKQNSSTLYDKIYIGRANVSSDDAFGFLPGELEDKTRPLLGCFYSNLEDLLRKGNREEDSQIQLQIEDMMETGLLRVFPLAYIRGMSIKNSFIICDETQNIGRSLIRDIVTRCGQGTKLVVLGDINQIDVAYLDKTNSGLTYLAHSMKGSSKCAQITFTERESVRSALATEALARLVNCNRKM